MINNNQRRAEPDLCAVLDQLEDSIKASINCISLGTIKTFYSDSQTADITLNYKRVNLVDGSFSNYSLLVKCPVVVISGGSGYMTMPIASGDTCVVMFCDREIDTWFTNGGVNAPQSARVHDLNDGIALVGVRNSLGPISTYGTSVTLAYGTRGYVSIDPSGNVDVNGLGVVTVKGDSINIQNKNNTGYATIDSSGNITVKGKSLNIFGAWQVKAYGSSYLAETDGFVMAVWLGTDNGIDGYTDSNNPPTTIVTENSYTIFFPVLKGNYWKVNIPAGYTPVTYWMPLGTT